MKRNSLFLALTALMVFSFGQVQGYGGLSLDHMDGIYSGDSVLCNKPIGFHIRLTNTSNCAILGSSNGFQVLMKQGGAFDSLVGGIHTEFPWADWYDLTGAAGGLVINEFPFDPVTGAMIIGFGGAAMMGPGIAAGFDEEVWHIMTQVDASADGDTICIDSAFYPPGGPWIWAMESPPCTTYAPTWTGPHCFHVYNVPDLNWEFSDCPTDTLHNTHCEIAQHQLHAYEQDPEDPELTATITLDLPK